MASIGQIALSVVTLARNKNIYNGGKFWYDQRIAVEKPKFEDKLGVLRTDTFNVNLNESNAAFKEIVNRDVKRFRRDGDEARWPNQGAREAEWEARRQREMAIFAASDRGTQDQRDVLAPHEAYVAARGKSEATALKLSNLKLESWSITLSGVTSLADVRVLGSTLPSWASTLTKDFGYDQAEIDRIDQEFKDATAAIDRLKTTIVDNTPWARLYVGNPPGDNDVRDLQAVSAEDRIKYGVDVGSGAENLRWRRVEYGFGENRVVEIYVEGQYLS